MVPLSIMFTGPSLAVIGEEPEDCVTGTASYAKQGRAKAFAANVGLVQLHAEPEDGRLLAAKLFGPASEHSAHLLAWAVSCRLTATDALDLPFYHPTYEEGLKPALRVICAKVCAPVPEDRDDGFLPGF